MSKRLFTRALALILLASWHSAAASETYTISGGAQVSVFDVFQECDVCPELIALPRGTFVMGAPLEESARLYAIWSRLVEPKPGEKPGFTREGPRHEVLADIPIAMGRNEVTRAEWLACVAEGGCSHTPVSTVTTGAKRPDPITVSPDTAFVIRAVKIIKVDVDHPRHPVMDVSYHDAQEYLAWLNAKLGTTKYRLPTEAEWEFAARAGTRTRFAQGDDLSQDQANFIRYADDGINSHADDKSVGVPVIVDQLDAANAWGLRHMSGNIREWTSSCVTERHRGFESTSHYLAVDQAQDQDCNRTVKGGHFSSSEEYSRLAYRGIAKPQSRLPSRGFRILKELD